MRNFGNNNNSRSRGPQGGRGGYDRRDSGRSSFGGGRDSGRDNRMHDATCDDCGDNCKLPFRPSSGKPVYCSQCFENRGNGNGNSGRDSRRPSFGGRDSRPSRDSRPARDSKPAKNYDRQLEYIEAKLNKILEILAPQEEVVEEKPVEAKPKKKKAAKKKVAKAKPKVEAVIEETPQVEVVEPIVEIEPEVVTEEVVAEVEPAVVAEEVVVEEPAA
jgi:CxxC-x17-CxxC domain-containing protein